METATIVLLVVLAAVLVAMLQALYRLLVVPRGYTRNVAIGFILTVIALDVAYIISEVWSGTPAGDAVAVATPFIQFWAAGALLHMVNTIEQFQVTRYRLLIALVIYVPIMIVCVVASGMLILNPSSVRIYYEFGTTRTDFGAGEMVFTAMGAIYATGILAQLVLILRKVGRSIRNEIVQTFILSLASFATVAYSVWIVPGLHTGALSFVFTSLISIVLGYAALRGSVLILPLREEPTVEAPVETLARGATYLFLGDNDRPRELFARFAKSGREGLWVTRKTPFIWLTGNKVEGEVCLDPREFGALSAVMINFIGKANDFVILFEGLEYVYTTAGFESTMRLVQFLNDKVMNSNGILMVVLSPEVFKPNEIALLRSEAAEVFPEAAAPDGGTTLARKPRQVVSRHVMSETSPPPINVSGIVLRRKVVRQ
jgi:hypothetical protein